MQILVLLHFVYGNISVEENQNSFEGRNYNRNTNIQK